MWTNFEKKLPRLMAYDSVSQMVCHSTSHTVWQESHRCTVKFSSS